MKVGEVTEREIPRGLAAFVREVRAILNGGVRLSDQMRTARFRFLSTQVPILVDASATRPPLALLCLSMRESRGDIATTISGAAITWRHSRAGIYVEAVDGAVPGVEYEIAIAIVEG